MQATAGQVLNALLQSLHDRVGGGGGWVLSETTKSTVALKRVPRVERPGQRSRLPKDL